MKIKRSGGRERGRTCTEGYGSGRGGNGRRRSEIRTRASGSGWGPTARRRKPLWLTTAPPSGSAATRPSSIFRTSPPPPKKQCFAVGAELPHPPPLLAAQPFLGFEFDNNEPPPPPAAAEVVSRPYELEEQISSLESFLGLEPEVAAEGGGEEVTVDLWMLDDLVNQYQYQQLPRQVAY
ncbi:unnamed protein product [Linum tenue]|uniref:Uncharacterized protein n=1 Tax=Linum tenue TaxID=586396 RepID=A0AAV0P8U2_9ROSI|nr:unnamed protein product [Linum tenue]